MAIKLNTTLSLSLLLIIILSLLLLIPSHCTYLKSEHEHKEEEEESAEGALFDCFLKCGQPRHGNHHQLSHCEAHCVRQYQERKREERDERTRPDEEVATENYEPEETYKQCRSKCSRQGKGQARRYCEQSCQWKYEKERREQERSHEGVEEETNPRKEESQQHQSYNPYFFKSHRFDTKYRTELGHIKVLERFSKKSDLLQGIDNYRLAILEANPNAFVLPHHCDAESVLVVVGGRGTVSYVWRKERRSFNLDRGDALRVPSGSILYLINRDENERLYVLKLLQPVNNPGQFKEYFGVGGENPEPFYKAFSHEILEAAFNTQRKDVEKLFGQKEGVIVRASKKQIRALSQESETSSRGGFFSSFNLTNKPLFSNQFGQYLEASPNDHEQLKDLDIAVGFMNIKKGAMIAPYYNSRSTKLAFVVGGSGYLQMACPHLSAQSKKQGDDQTRSGVHYEKIRARLSEGDAFIVPAGHPITIVASQESNLQLASFGIKGSHNQKHFLAGQENIWKEVESEAKELAFNIPAGEVEEIFGKQDESYFLAGPEERERRERHSVASVLDFVGF